MIQVLTWLYSWKRNNKPLFLFESVQFSYLRYYETIFAIPVGMLFTLARQFVGLLHTVPTKLKRTPRPENLVLSLHYCWAWFEISTQVRVTDEEQRTISSLSFLSNHIAGNRLSRGHVKKEDCGLQTVQTLQTVLIVQTAECRLCRLRTARLQPFQTADFADLTDCPSCADYPDGRPRSLCRPQTVQTVQTADNEDCWFFRLRRLSRLETMKTADCFDCKDYADFCRMCRLCKLCGFFSQKRNLTFITYFARYSNKTFSAIAIKSEMVEAWHTRTSIAARRVNARGLK